MPRSTASDLGLHCLPTSLLWDARHKWVNYFYSMENSPLILCSSKLRICVRSTWNKFYLILLFLAETYSIFHSVCSSRHNDDSTHSRTAKSKNKQNICTVWGQGTQFVRLFCNRPSEQSLSAYRISEPYNALIEVKTRWDRVLSKHDACWKAGFHITRANLSGHLLIMRTLIHL